MLLVIRSRTPLLSLLLGIAGLALGGTGCHSGPTSQRAAQETVQPLGIAASTPPAEGATEETDRGNVLEALRLLSPDFGRSPSESGEKIKRADSTLPESLKNWVGVGLICTQIIEAGKVYEISGSPLAKPYALRVKDRGRTLELKVRGPQPGIVILSTGEIWGGLTETVMARFASREDGTRRSRLLDFVVVPMDAGQKVSAELRLELQMIRVWQQATQVQVLDRCIRFTSDDGRFLVEFCRVGGLA